MISKSYMICIKRIILPLQNEIRRDIKNCKNIQMELINVKNCCKLH